MSSTRRAKNDSAFRQERYASSEDFERGLKATAVAKKCSILQDRAEREMLWFIQYLSNLEEGIESVADNIMLRFSDRIQTRAMAEIGMAPKKILTVDQVKAIRHDFPVNRQGRFPLNGEGKIAGYPAHFSNEHIAELQGGRVSVEECELQREKFNGLPSGYPSEEFVLFCLEEAESDLAKYLYEFCLNPSIKPRQGPWYFPDLYNALCDYKARWEMEKSNGVVTNLGAIVIDKLTFALKTHSLVVVEGNPRLGKSYSGRTLCEQNPGKMRFIEVPPFNDDAGFFKALARGLGLGNFTNYKAHEIRDRVESVLRCGDLLLVLDEAQRLWPQHNLRRGFPSRIVWIMTMANAGVPIALISTPQFTASQKEMEKNWKSSQLTGRIGDYVFLPVTLSQEDLMAVAHVLLPEASPKLLKMIAIYCQTSDRQLSAAETISKRARYNAENDNRTICTDADIASAMKLSVIPSDTMLKQALKEASAPKRRGRPPGGIAQLESAETVVDAAFARDFIPDQTSNCGNRSITPANVLTEV